MVNSVCFLSWWKILAWGSWNFEFVWILLINWIADSFPRHAWCTLSVLFREGQFLLEAVGILSLWKYSWPIGLQIVFLGTLSFFSWWKILAWGSWNFKLVEILLIKWIADWFCMHTWCALSIFFHDGKFLLEAVAILSLWKYCLSIGLQVDFLDMHGLHSLCSPGCKVCLEAVGIWRLWKYSWSIGLQIVFLCTHGVHSLLIQNS